MLVVIGAVAVAVAGEETGGRVDCWWSGGGAGGGVEEGAEGLISSDMAAEGEGTWGARAAHCHGPYHEMEIEIAGGKGLGALLREGQGRGRERLSVVDGLLALLCVCLRLKPG